ncbi:hypothetical protein AOLI_G00326900 [Acnodon oligacanthus]
MATSKPRRTLIWDIHKRLPTLKLRQLRTLAAALESEQRKDAPNVSTLSEPELYYITDYVKSEKLQSLEEEGSTKIVKIPIQNSTQHDIYLAQRKVLDSLEEITDLIPMFRQKHSSGPVTQPADAQANSAQVATDKSRERVNTSEKWNPPFDLSHLQEVEQEAVRCMFYEESGFLKILQRADESTGLVVRSRNNRAIGKAPGQLPSKTPITWTAEHQAVVAKS